MARKWVWVALALLGVSGPVAAQEAAAGSSPDTAQGAVALSVAEAVSLALDRSEEVGVARARLTGAQAQARKSWAAALPQVSAQLGYTKTLRSVFQNVGGGFTLPDSLKFDPNPNAPLEQRVSYLEDKVPSAAFGALGQLFSGLPFGNENTWLAGLSFSQPLFTGGRVRSEIQLAHYNEDAAEATYEEAAGDIVLQVKQAYYDAALARSAVEIVESSVKLAQEHRNDVQLRYEAGRESELDVMRAEVELQNLRPQLVQAKNAVELSTLNLKRLVNIPLDADIALTTSIVPSGGAEAFDSGLPGLDAAAEQLKQRASVRAGEAQVAIREEQVDMARAAYFPTVSLTGNLSRQAYPTTLRFPSGGDWRDDWTVGFSIQWPVFAALRDAQVDAAKAQAKEAELQQKQLVEGVQVQYQQALGELERSRAQIEAARRTVAQAEKVYELTEMRFREGLATQLEVSQARLSLQQARLNDVQAYHDAYVALAQAQRALGTGVELVER